MTPKNPKRRVNLGATGNTVRANIARIRDDRRLTLRKLSTLLGEVGRPLGHTAISDIENGSRRVDVDDLIALAVALGVSPNTLLMPSPEEYKGAEEKTVDVTGSPDPVDPNDYWTFLDGMRPIGSRNLGRLDAYDFVIRSLPPYLSLVSQQRTITSSLDIPFIHRETETDGLVVKERFKTGDKSMFRKDEDD